MSSSNELERMRILLCELQNHLRKIICTARDADTAQALAGVAEVTPADTIYEIDKISESAIVAWFAEHWPAELPVELIMEGAEAHGAITIPKGTPIGETAWKCILDPIDGTRNMMYDKRAAWALAGIAPQRGGKNTLQDIAVAAMTALPTSREWRSDQLSAIRGEGLFCTACDMRDGTSGPIEFHPSKASDCQHGFASVVRFFPDGLGLLGELEERLWKKLYPDAPGGSPLVFNDQYITTGGQLYELIAGHDRFIADLRPLVFKKLGLDGSLSTHPYDLAAALVAEEAGIVLVDPVSGKALNAPLDTTTPVAWVAFANEAIAAHIGPVLNKLIQEML
ncbi:inositol monophosphatase [Puniceicoccales bacterium CK1056]|uniref:Inositol monophosphatase n=1 Tax=Oceanipulchritudo coccoides TaxID=2706888 RepID=A0A6B2M294_9BACT|nr:inositol monophosphatase family protein [Oceanipulchritudo coccoides]NDV63058.1 inositol monophosphatase [Oceanipulchritudo coccoides]